MIVYTNKIVINTQFGGFSLDLEMANWLVKNKNWIITDDAESQEHDLIVVGMNYFYPSNKYQDIQFRMLPDFIECVEFLQQKHKNISYINRYRHQVLNLSIVKFDIDLTVEDIYDGKEAIRVNYESNN
jgi:hypothetical protein